MTPQNLIDGLTKKNKELSDKNDEYENLNSLYAEAQRSYAIELAKKITELKINGQAITVIKELAKGDEHVANLRYNRDIAKGIMKACVSSIKNMREQIGSYRSLLTWLREELGNG